MNKIYRDKITERFCGLAVFNPKHGGNIGTLFRTAACLGNVDFLATIGEKYVAPHSDTISSTKRIPCFHFENFKDFYNHLPQHCQLVGVELCRSSIDIREFKSPNRVCYLMGSEDQGIPESILSSCYHTVCIPSPLGISMNLGAAGSIVLYHQLLSAT